MIAEALISKLDELEPYGPVKIVTRQADIPPGEGVRHAKALPTDKDQRNHVFISSGSWDAERFDDEVTLYLGSDGEHTGRLWVDDVEYLQIDHPLGQDMPLNGRKVMRLSSYDRGGLLVPRWADHAIEFNLHSVIESGMHPEHPGVGLVKSYDVFDVPAEQDISIETAKKLGGHCMMFLVSRGWHWQESADMPPFHIVTSRMGSKSKLERPMTVRPPRHPSGVPLMQVEMLDVPSRVSDEELLERHVRRLVDLNYEYRSQSKVPRSTQMQIDAAYLYISND